MQDLGGTVYSALADADGTQDPYTLVESRHLPPVKLYDLQVILYIFINSRKVIISEIGNDGRLEVVSRLPYRSCRGWRCI